MKLKLLVCAIVGQSSAQPCQLDTSGPIMPASGATCAECRRWSTRAVAGVRDPAKSLRGLASAVAGTQTATTAATSAVSLERGTHAQARLARRGCAACDISDGSQTLASCRHGRLSSFPDAVNTVLPGIANELPSDRG